ncbi:MAG: HAD family hydrolase [Candidatus Aenigmatarchaeota archaeon]
MEAVIFDMDGVVVDTEQYWIEEEREMIEKLGFDGITPETLAGMSITNTYEFLADRYDISMTEEEFFRLYENRAHEVYWDKAELMPGLEELMERLRENGLKIGLATGSYWPDYVIERFDLDFDTVVSSGTVEGPGKPDPETYRLAVQNLGVEPAEAVAVEDTDSGLKSAKEAGLYCIGYLGSTGQQLSEADETVEGPAELRERLLELISR